MTQGPRLRLRRPCDHRYPRLGGAPTVAEDTLKVATGLPGNWNGAVGELGQRVGIFKRHRLVPLIFITAPLLSEQRKELIEIPPRKRS